MGYLSLDRGTAGRIDGLGGIMIHQSNHLVGCTGFILLLGENMPRLPGDALITLAF